MRLANFLKKQFDMALSVPLPEGEYIDRNEMPESEMLPYKIHYDDETVTTKDDGLVQVIKLDGLYYESLTPEQIKQYERQRNTVLRSIANSDRGVYVHLVRRKINRYPSGEYSNWFANYFNDLWMKRYEKRSFFINEIYISIVRNRFRQGPAGLIDRALNGLTGNHGEKGEETFEEQAKDVYEATNLLLQTLSAYGPRRLRILRTEYGDFSEIGRFLHYLTNLEDVPFPVSEQPLDKSMSVSHLHFSAAFGANAMEIVGVSESRLAAVMSMQQWPERTPSRMLDEFLKLPVEFIITQSFFFLDRIASESDMKQQRDRMIQANDIASDQIEDIKTGLRELGAGRAVNGLHHLSILVHVPSIKNEGKASLASLDAAVDQIKKGFVNLNVKPVREYFAIETFFWSQLPGQAEKFIGRRGKISSANFAGFAALHNYAIGKIDGNLWGPAIMPFETVSRTPYFFNFHREMEGMVAGHTAVTADTGAGKTTLLSALVVQADKANPTVVWFDNRHGAEVLIRAMGGQHTLLSVQGSMGWNPFKLLDTADNRSYLFDLLCMMRTCYGGTLTPDDIERFKRAVKENYLLDEADRRLSNVAWCFGNDLSKDMRIWYGTGENAGAFDNVDDNVDLTMCRHHCYEMEQLIKDSVARPELPVILSYPFHRIEQAMKGKPFMIVLEEGQNLVMHDYWRKKIDAYIMQIRRKNGMLVFVTPDAKYLYCETDSIMKQTVTKIYLPNQNAQEEDYVQKLGLTRSEFEFVSETPAESRQFLIRRGRESVKAVFDLSDIQQVIPVLSSNDKGVALMHEVMKELDTTEPSVWVPVFIQRAMEKNTHNLKQKEIQS